MKTRTKIIIGAIGFVVLTISLVIAFPFGAMAIRTHDLNKDYEYLKTHETYSKKAEVNNLELVKQHISCGYATIEMLSEYYGDKVTEDDLDKKNNGGVSTSSTNGFLKEANTSINHEFVKKTYLANNKFLEEIHSALSEDKPVAIEWAAKFENEWTLHFSIVSSLDIANDNVTVYNPYGYIENIKVNEFLDRTTFKAYKNIPLFLNFGFAFGAFHKNALFY